MLEHILFWPFSTDRLCTLQSILKLTFSHILAAAGPKCSFKSFNWYQETRANFWGFSGTSLASCLLLNWFKNYFIHLHGLASIYLTDVPFCPFSATQVGRSFLIVPESRRQLRGLPFLSCAKVGESPSPTHPDPLPIFKSFLKSLLLMAF